MSVKDDEKQQQQQQTNKQQTNNNPTFWRLRMGVSFLNSLAHPCHMNYFDSSPQVFVSHSSLKKSCNSEEAASNESSMGAPFSS